jgi:LPXTG-motif cell wall-anchored protein
VRTSVRRLTRIGVMSAVVALAALPVFATSAAAADPPPSPGPCTFTVTPKPVASFPADVVVSGTVPQSGVTVTAFVNGVADGSVVAGANLQLSIPVHLTSAANISVNYFFGNKNAYSTGCADPGGALVVRVDVASAAATQSRALAFTGSNNTLSFVLVGVAALVVGLVLTVGARRRNKVSV